MTAATADTAEAMELIAVQMLSIGFLLSVDNYYNNKVCKESKSDTPRKVEPCGKSAVYLMWMVQLSPLGAPVSASSLVKVSDCRDPVRPSLSILALVVISAPPDDKGLEVDDASSRLTDSPFASIPFTPLSEVDIDPMMLALALSVAISTLMEEFGAWDDVKVRLPSLIPAFDMSTLAVEHAPSPVLVVFTSCAVPHPARPSSPKHKTKQAAVLPLPMILSIPTQHSVTLTD